MSIRGATPLVLVSLSILAVGCATDPRAGMPPAPRYDVSLAEAPIEMGEPVATDAAEELDPDEARFYKAGRLTFGVQPTTAELDAFARGGVTEVICLRSNEELATPEARRSERRAEQLGLRYVHIPLGGDDSYAESDLRAFAAELHRIDGAALVHCSSGGRARTMWVAYLVSERGYDINDAAAVADTLGGKPWGLERLLGRQIDYRLGAPLPEDIKKDKPAPKPCPETGKMGH